MTAAIFCICTEAEQGQPPYFVYALKLKQSRGNNSDSMQARVVIPVCDTSS